MALAIVVRPHPVIREQTEKIWQPQGQTCSQSGSRLMMIAEF